MGDKNAMTVGKIQNGDKGSDRSCVLGSWVSSLPVPPASHGLFRLSGAQS